MASFCAAYISILISLSPGVFMMHFTFWNRQRAPKWTVIPVYVGWAVVCLVVLWLNGGTEPTLEQVQMLKLMGILYLVPVPFLLIRCSVYQYIFISCMLITHAMMLTRLSTYIETRWFAGAVLRGEFGLNNWIILSSYAATLPFLAWFIRRRYVPALDKVDERAWRFIWLLPTTFTALFLTYVSEVSEHNITSLRSVIVVVPLTLGMFICCYTLLYLLGQAAERSRLETEVSATNRLLTLQREQYTRITENAEQIKAMRHDMRHQLAVIRAGVHEPDKLTAYLDEIEAATPAMPDRACCENYAVNAVANHYLSIAEQEGARPDVRLDVPEETGRVTGVDLCVILGNFLENAVEASRRIGQEKRHIRVRSRVENGYLSIVVENRFDGQWQQKDGVFLSGKREGAQGMGLVSVKAVCAKYDGMTKFSVDDDIFKASAVVNMKGTGEGVESP